MLTREGEELLKEIAQSMGYKIVNQGEGDFDTGNLPNIKISEEYAKILKTKGFIGGMFDKEDSMERFLPLTFYPVICWVIVILVFLTSILIVTLEV
jgi:hypothetical protein